MHNIKQIIHYELITILTKKSYLIFLFLVPLIGFIFYSGSLLINREIAPEGITDLFSSGGQTNQAIVDRSGLIAAIPEEIGNQITLVMDETSARKMIEEGRISSFFIISEDYLESGKVDFIQKDYNFLATQAETENLRRVIIANLFNDSKATQRYLKPMNLTITYTSEPRENDFGGPDNFWLPYAVMMLFYMLIIGASSMMLNSITNDKKNRVIEILLTSASPTQLLIGKTISLGIAGLLQSIAWLGSAYTLLALAGRQLSLPDAYHLEPSLLAWGFIYFFLGFALYSSLMAGLGALVPNPKEGSQATMVVIFPLLIPLLFSNIMASTPNARMFVIFSIFPLTSPISMISRMSATTVPGWKIVLSVVLLISAIIFVVRVVARLFRAQALLSGKPFKVKEYLQAFIHSK